MEERGEKQRQVSNKKEQIFLQQYHQKMEQEIIQPIDKELLKQELTPERQLRMTNKSNNEIYIVTAHEAPNVMKEIGRLREIAFREAGGGTGKSMDIDEFDTMPNSYKQLIVWNPETNTPQSSAASQNESSPAYLHDTASYPFAQKPHPA